MFDDKDDKKPLRILLDSDSLKSDSAKRLLHYNDNELFEFVSLGKSTKHTVANLDFGERVENSSIIIDKSANSFNGYKEHIWFGYRITDIKATSKSIDIKYPDLILVFILATLTKTGSNKKTILITEKKKLLDRINWTKGGFPSVPAYSILSPDEALLFVDLHCKKNNKYLTAPNSYANRMFWYLYSLKTKLPNYQQAWSSVVFNAKEMPDRKNLMEITASLGDRITDMLIAVDEIGINYYTDINNDTQDAIIYHFNYWIMMFTGVFDSLAWISKYRYQIKFEKFGGIGLRTGRQKQFTKLLFDKNNKIKNFLSKNSSVVSLMYDPRDLVIHRARLKGLRFDNRDENFYFNMVRIPEDFFKQIMELSKEKGDVLGKWGHYKSHNEYFLEPYRFVKEATFVLIDFVNEYLEILDFNEYQKSGTKLKKKIEDNHNSKGHKDFLQDLDRFEKFRIGY